MVEPERRGHGDFLCWLVSRVLGTGCRVRVGLAPLEIDIVKCRGISNRGEARGASDSGQKNRCPCPSLLGFGHKWSIRPK